MRTTSPGFWVEKIGNFTEGALNLLWYFPYLFSVVELLRTLFLPWKGLTDQSKERGFSFSGFFNRLMFNCISIGIGFCARATLLITFFLVQSTYILLLPFLFILFFLTLPLQYVVYLVSPSREEIKKRLRDRFVQTHALKPENHSVVESWFETEYEEHYRKSLWWKLENLTNSTPLAKDWSAGFTVHLDEYVIELTSPAYQSRISHIIGRAKEISLIENALLKSEEANALLVGEEGVGRHTILDAFAQNIYFGRCNALLAYRRVLLLQMEKVLARYTDAKERENFVATLFDEAARSGNVILAIDNFDRYVSGGEANRLDLSIPFEHYGKTNRIQIIGMTTPYEYDKYIFPNEKIRMIFNKVDIAEISKGDTLRILMDINSIMERRYKLYIPYETLLAVVEKSDFFITSVPFPEKAIQLLDSACVFTKEHAARAIVTPEVIDSVLSEHIHVPTTLNDELKGKLLSLENDLSSQVVNQNEAIHELAAAMRRAFLLLGKRKKPLVSFLFLGPTGVGKTETAKAIARLFFGAEKTMLRFDMSLYQTKEDIPKLVGSPESHEPGLLTDAIRRQPYGVLLLDEIEKADKNLLNIFLTILDEGYYTDGYGKRVDCKNLVIIATSNAGADFIFQKLQQGTVPGSNELIAHLIEKRLFTPEFLNRFDGVIAYKPIQQDNMVTIARKMMAGIEKQIMELHQVHLEVSDATLQAVLSRNFDPAFGARNLERVLRNEIEDQVAQLILAGKAPPGSTIRM
ncbi:MAG: AAA family ATPase [Patescibacteria group bacterium]|nr:AAA family ATPase [Patescibacteria group bacterium]